MKRKILCVLFAAALAAMCLFAVSCSGNGGDSDDSSNEAVSGNDGVTETDVTTDNNETNAMTDEPYESAMATENEDTTSSKSYSDPYDDGSVTTNTAAENTTAADSDDGSEMTVYTIKYVALGDSICYGYGLDSPETERYSVLVASYIDAYEYYECGEYNYGVNGQTSSELLETLKNGEITELSDADVVTVSIGANNILSPATSFFINYVAASLIEDDTTRNAALASLYTDFISELDAGVAAFEADLPEIIENIYKSAPIAEIIFQTVYNPFRNFDLAIDTGNGEVSLSELADVYITKINDIINGNWGVYGYEIADIYTAFESEIDVVFADAAGTSLLSFDPHPTAKGHELIAKTIFALIYLD
ncbi:MAG: GDSL-type esterase/lipase family protein [Firmicutes bacterium]|nr:GDSL-type esterase/lipase family protein [Bacillota bacterium]